MSDKWFVASIYTYRFVEDRIVLSKEAWLVGAEDDKHAQEKTFDMAREIYRQSDGWCGLSVNVGEITRSTMEEMARDYGIIK